MKFVHIADLHLDVPFTTLSKNGLADARRLEQRKALKKVIEYIQNNEIHYLLIAGDLYEQEYVKKSSIEYINELFSSIPNTKIYIAPGNHDPYLKNSYYKQFKWSSNVFIFGPEVTKISEPEVDIYGFGFDDFYQKENKIKNIMIENRNKINILLTHGTLDGASTQDKQYNPISTKELIKEGFDYVALGHIHKPCTNNESNTRIVYPGSLISLGFDEQGKHGMVVAQVEKQQSALSFVTLDEKMLVEGIVEVDDIQSKEELIEEINSLQIEENKLYKICLQGQRNFEIHTSEIEKYIQNKHIVKIKDQTKTRIPIEELAKQNNLKGIFIRNILKKMEKRRH